MVCGHIHPIVVRHTSDTPLHYAPARRRILARRVHQEPQGVGKMVECPVCDAELELSSDAVEGELMECADCGTELEVTSVNPPEVAEAPETEEDWGE